MIQFGNAPLTYMEIKDLTKFFRSKGHLEKAVAIYDKEGLVAVMDYKYRLEHIKSDINEKKEIVSFCTRCFGNSAVAVDEDTNFCHNCGSEGTCISIKKDEADYLRTNIEYAIANARRYGCDCKNRK